jgi:small nuclear ribonucleoprotein (snRNP)-like protein
VRSSRLLRERLLTRLIVTLKNGQSFEGVLYELDDRAWFLRDACAIGAGEKNTNLPLDGEVVLLTSEIAFAQRP